MQVDVGGIVGILQQASEIVGSSRSAKREQYVECLVKPVGITRRRRCAVQLVEDGATLVGKMGACFVTPPCPLDSRGSLEALSFGLALLPVGLGVGYGLCGAGDGGRRPGGVGKGISSGTTEVDVSRSPGVTRKG